MSLVEFLYIFYVKVALIIIIHMKMLEFLKRENRKQNIPLAMNIDTSWSLSGISKICSFFDRFSSNSYFVHRLRNFSLSTKFIRLNSCCFELEHVSNLIHLMIVYLNNNWISVMEYLDSSNIFEMNVNTLSISNMPFGFWIQFHMFKCIEFMRTLICRIRCYNFWFYDFRKTTHSVFGEISGGFSSPTKITDSMEYVAHYKN